MSHRGRDPEGVYLPSQLLPCSLCFLAAMRQAAFFRQASVPGQCVSEPANYRLKKREPKSTPSPLNCGFGVLCLSPRPQHPLYHYILKVEDSHIDHFLNKHGATTASSVSTTTPNTFSIFEVDKGVLCQLFSKCLLPVRLSYPSPGIFRVLLTAAVGWCSLKEDARKRWFLQLPHRV